MTPIPATSHGLSFSFIEGGLTVIAVALAFCWPKILSSLFSQLEVQFSRLARRRGLAVLVVGLSALLLRIAILPLVPSPLPFIPDDFSFLLAAKTFASGRLAIPTPSMWVHFETIHVTMQPTYVSMYFPAQALLLAAGKFLLGSPWCGVLLSSALMCAAICWMLQAWLPPTWALLGGLMAVLHLSLFSYWVNTYSGGGCIAALGGALVLGGLPRLMKSPGHRVALLMAVGIVLLANSRPYEGLLLCLPVAIYMVRWLSSGPRPAPRVLARVAAAPLLLLVAAGAWMGYYNYRAFGSPLTPPYKVDRTTYAMAPYYVWQSARPAPVYRHAVLRDFYYNNELAEFQKIHSVHGFIPETMVKAIRGMLFFTGLALLPPLFMARRVLRDRQTRFLVICVAVLAGGMLIENFLIPHYLAPFTAGFYALGLQAMRHLRVWKFADQPVGLAMVRLVVTGCVLMAGLRIFAEPLRIQIPRRPASNWTDKWYGPARFGTARAQIEAKLEQAAGGQLAIVRYGSNHDNLDEWVYNDPDIDSSKVIWARGMSDSEDLELIHYYKGRQVWLVQPDQNPAGLAPYPLPAQTISASVTPARP